MEEKIEEARTNKEFNRFIYAENQNTEEMINPDFIMRVDEKGNALPLASPILQPLEKVMYWQNKTQTLGFIIFISSMTLLFLLLNETKMLNQVFGLFQFLINIILGLF